MATRLKYPEVARGDVTSTYGDVTVADPYRWLEEQDSEETQAFVRSQQALTDPYIEALPSRTAIAERLRKVHNYEKFSVPFRRGSYYYYFHNSGLQNQSVLYRQAEEGGEDEVVIDPNAWSEEGTDALGSVKFSEDAKTIGYTVNEKGSDWQTAYFQKADGEKLADKLEWLKFTGLAWAKDGSGVYYCRFDKPKDVDSDSKGTEGDSNLNQRMCFHRLGTEQADDEVVYSSPENPSWMFRPVASDEGNYLVVAVVKDCNPVKRIFVRDLEHPEKEDLWLVDAFENDYCYVTNVGTRFYFQTQTEVVSVDITAPKEWTTVLPATDNVLEDVTCVADSYLVAIYIEDVKHVVKVYNLEGEHQHDVQLPSYGTVGLSGRKKDAKAFYKFTSFTYPGTIYAYDPATNTSTLYKQVTVPGFSPDDFTARQVFYPSKDGTQVPMFIVMPKGLSVDENTPVHLYGYGGFDISLMPFFSSFYCTFMRGFGAIVAVANLRGGGEYGKKWHEAGQKANKQNVFDDFIAAAEYLIAEKYTSAKKLAIAGGSNGGLLVAAVTTQRPELFGAVLCSVGVLDMLRFHKFTIGHYWVSDYGCADEEEDFKYLYAYSPLHNVRKGKAYPPMLLLTADHDDRVVPGHSFKFIAQLQHVLGEEDYQTAPLLIRIESNAGHGGGKPTGKVIQEAADKFAFLGKALDVQWKDQ